MLVLSLRRTYEERWGGRNRVKVHDMLVAVREEWLENGS